MCFVYFHHHLLMPSFLLQAWSVVPTVLSEADAAHLVGMCAACKRSDGDPFGALQLGVRASEILRIHDAQRTTYQKDYVPST